MKNLEWKLIDKSAWGDGPWQNEPDKIQWLDEKTSLPCLAVRHKRYGNWCGYVGVGPEHPFFNMDSQDVYEKADVRVHGGLTFSDFCTGQEHGICHVVEPGENDRVWWLGFDCSHSGDLSPGFKLLTNTIAPAIHFKFNENYRNIDYIKAQCSKLAEQLVNINEKQ